MRNLFNRVSHKAYSQKEWAFVLPLAPYASRVLETN
jgi:hypothetical protein